MPNKLTLDLTPQEAQVLYALADRGIQAGLPGGFNTLPIAFSVVQKMAALGQEQAVEQEEPTNG